MSDTDILQTAGILQERLQAWKHAVGYLEDYLTATEKVEKAHAKEYEKVLKVHTASCVTSIAALIAHRPSPTR